ncbi:MULTISPECIES: hypothetical protein [Spirulina sp. CCY15215]|uniref:hypothetical protein n=1 Tax=Spirulina sp. CCY15215 TaxID=2767591 RepID=UPI00194E1D42|nr:hypothetical protein [Spirulina major]
MKSLALIIAFSSGAALIAANALAQTTDIPASHFYQTLKPTNQLLFGGVGYGSPNTGFDEGGAASAPVDIYSRAGLVTYRAESLGDLSCLPNTNGDNVRCFGERDYVVTIIPTDQWKVTSDFTIDDKLANYDFAASEPIDVQIDTRPLQNNPSAAVKFGVNF